MRILGSQMFLADFAVVGILDEEHASRLVTFLIENMGMAPAHTPTTYWYPVDGKGGVGFTFVQPLTESFVAVDAWPDIGGSYISLRSCRPFSVKDVIWVIESFGFEVTKHTEAYLELNRAPNLRQ